MARLILDSSALIALDRAGDAEAPLPDDDAAITASQLLVGVELGGSRHRAERRAFVDGILERVRILAFDLGVARHQAQLLA